VQWGKLRISKFKDIAEKFSFPLRYFFVSLNLELPSIIDQYQSTEEFMKILTNEKTIRRNAKIGQYTSLASLLILAGGMYVSFAYPTQLYISFLALLVGFILSQVGIFFGNRWGRRPRVDERLTNALKGLNKDYTMYHFLTPVNHLLVGPAGVWILAPFYQRGTIVYENNKWKQKGGGFFLSYLKIFAQEGLGRPDIEIKADTENLSNHLTKILGEGQQIPTVNVAMVFTDDRAVVQAEGAPNPAMKIDQLKEFIRKTAKQNPLALDDVKRVIDELPDESIE
jgi:hypothetical protein